jgi:hypothetical protein
VLVGKVNDEGARVRDEEQQKEMNGSPQHKFAPLVIRKQVLLQVIKQAPKGISASRFGWRYEFFLPPW